MQVEVSFPSATRVRAQSRDLTVEVGPPPDPQITTSVVAAVPREA
jgi:hypothetical protein